MVQIGPVTEKWDQKRSRSIRPLWFESWSLTHQSGLFLQTASPFCVRAFVLVYSFKDWMIQEKCSKKEPEEQPCSGTNPTYSIVLSKSCFCHNFQVGQRTSLLFSWTLCAETKPTPGCEPIFDFSETYVQANFFTFQFSHKYTLPQWLPSLVRTDLPLQQETDNVWPQAVCAHYHRLSGQYRS